ncbi:MAG: FAD-dependent oxidoreductase [Nitrospira sp.]
MSATPHVLIIGVGLAGLACARQLSLAGLSCTILEASDGVGGRVGTDHVSDRESLVGDSLHVGL